MPMELLVFGLGQPHRPEQTVIDDSISWETVIALVCQNSIMSSGTDYAIDRATVISSSREPLLNAKHD